MHPSGAAYEWLPGLSPDDCDPPELPKEVIAKLWNLSGEDKVDDPEAKPKSVRKALYEQPTVPEGNRDNVLYAEACALWNEQLQIRGAVCFDSAECQSIVFRRLWAWNSAACKPPMDDQAVLAKCEGGRLFVRSAAAREQQVSGHVMRDPATGRAEGWRLTIVDSEPPQYKLYAPHWPGLLLLSGSQFRRFSSVCDEALRQKSAWVPTTLAMQWKDTKKKRSLPSELVSSADHEAAPPEVKRSEVVTELVVDLMAADVRKVLEPDVKPVLHDLPAKDSEGGVYFVFQWLWESLARGMDKVGRNELSGVLRELGVEDRAIGTGAAKRTVKYLPVAAASRGGRYWRRGEV